MEEEQVLVVPAEALREVGYFEGFAYPSDKYIFAPERQQFMPRGQAEQDASFKQLIPYVIIVRGGLVAAYSRGKAAGEKRLRSRRSIGFGGHINPNDGFGVPKAVKGLDNFDKRYVAGLMRELQEELKFIPPKRQWAFQTVGFINDDETDVGRVHFGIVHMLNLPVGRRMVAREADIQNLDWRTPDDLQKHTAEFEVWSQLCIRQLCR
jgi:predicted NUDIX family phosphoesterase